MDKRDLKAFHDPFDTKGCSCGRCRRGRWIMAQHAWHVLDNYELSALVALFYFVGEQHGQGPATKRQLQEGITHPDELAQGRVVPMGKVNVALAQLRKLGLVEIVGTDKRGGPNIWHVAPSFDEEQRERDEWRGQMRAALEPLPDSVKAVLAPVVVEMDRDGQRGIAERLVQNWRVGRALVRHRVRKRREQRWLKQWMRENEQLPPKARQWLRAEAHKT